MNDIEKYISENNYTEALNECSLENQNYLGILLCHIIAKDSLNKCDVSGILTQMKNDIKGFVTEGVVINEEKNLDNVDDNPSLLEDEVRVKVSEREQEDEKKYIRIKLLPHWCSSEALRGVWNRMSKGDYKWNNIKIVLDDDPDYFVVINCPPNGMVLTENEKKKTIVFQMEPYMNSNFKHLWGEWASPDPSKFFRVCSHDKSILNYNNNEWNLNKTYNELKDQRIEKDDKLDCVLSTVLSSKYQDPGHIKRVDFVKFLEKKGLPVHVFGSDKFCYKDYKGFLPPYEKDNAMFPYKYAFNVENNSIKNYYTEKLIDGILGECLVFYSGCFNIRDFIDERAYIYLELSNFEVDYQKVKNAIEGKEWEKRIDIIRSQKMKILNYLQFFPRIERIINKNEDISYTS